MSVARIKRRGLKRSGFKREPYDRVLIVCEGAKTEPNYLQELLKTYHLSSANIEVTGEGGSAPMSVVEHAINRFEDDPEFDRVFCVIDRDQHPRFGEAVQRIREKRLIRRDSKRKKMGTARFEAIASIPCFEFWIFLHYQYTTAEMPCYDDVRHRLKQIEGFEKYDKGTRGLFAQTREHIDTALNHADRANAEAQRNDTDNPTTQMPTLIRYLQQLAENNP